MKSFYLSLALIGAASVAAQGGSQGTEQILKTLPKCAVRPLFLSLHRLHLTNKTGCGLGSTSKNCRKFDVECTCKDQSYLSDLSCCMSKQCNAHEIEGKS